MSTMSVTEDRHTKRQAFVSSFHFRQLANLITVADICEPFIRTIEGERPVMEVLDEWSIDWCMDEGLNPMDQVALVEKDGRTQGWIGYDMLDEGETVSDCMELIIPDAILTADTCLADVAAALHHSPHPFFVVLKGNHFIGWCSNSDLRKPPFRLCLFAMLINIERLLLDVILLSAQASVKLLSPGRLSKAKNIYALRRYAYDKEDKPYAAKLLECTTIADKITLARKLPNVREAVHAFSNARFCSRAERLRNEIAHPGSEKKRSSLWERRQLWPFIKWAETLESQLERFLNTDESV